MKKKIGGNLEQCKIEASKVDPPFNNKHDSDVTVIFNVTEINETCDNKLTALRKFVNRLKCKLRKIHI